MNGSLWVKDFCPECKKANWMYYGPFDVHDDTASIGEGIECWNCGHCWVFDPHEWRVEKLYEVIEDGPEEDEDAFLKTGEAYGKPFTYWVKEIAYLEKGRENPNV